MFKSRAWRLFWLIVFSTPTIAQEAVVYSLVGNHRSDRLGIALAPVGDIDNDGVPDFVAGADQPYADNPTPAGYVHLVSGKTGIVLHTWKGEKPGIGFGATISSIGDFDKDGNVDFAVGSEAPIVNIISAATKETLLTIDARLGTGAQYIQFAGTPDVDGDTVPDLIVSDPGYHVELNGKLEFLVGRASVYSGKDGSRLWLRLGERQRDLLGSSLASIGDLDADGMEDIAVGRPRGRHSVSRQDQNIGEVLILRGRDGSILRTLGNIPQLFTFGETMASLGDIDKDGRPELAIAAPGYAKPGENHEDYNRGWVGVYSTRTFELLHEFKGVDGYIHQANFQGDALGYRLSAAGDADGDGVPDILIGAERWSSFSDYYGRIHLRSGKTGELLASYEAIPSSISERLLGSLSPLGDVDGDGRDEFLVGAWYNPPFGPDDRKGMVLALRYQPQLPIFIRGDANLDGQVDISDVVFIINHIYFSGSEGNCRLALDVDGSDELNSFDFLIILYYLFLEGISPASPFPECGRFGGLRKSSLDCRSSPCKARG